MSETLNKLFDSRKEALRELLNQCTEEQQELFNRMYKSIDEIPEEKMDWAIQQCERTIVKNENKVQI